MTIGFFGKGGSGKTTTCFQFLRVLRDEYPSVFAIDADHNMDLAFNLGVEDIAPYVGQIGTLPSGIRFIAAGPHTEEVFRGDVCSHYLFRPLKEKLRNQEQASHELVLVDNTAGMDSVGAGIPALLDAAIVCVEPAVHSIKVGRQIVDALRRTSTPTVIAANKIQSPEQQETLKQAFPDLTVIAFPFEPTTPDKNPSSATISAVQAARNAFVHP